MRIFALETDKEKLQKHFLSTDEQVLMTVYYHWFKFLGSFVWMTLFTALLIALAIWSFEQWGVSWEWSLGTAFVVWLFFIFPKFIRTYIDWRYDFIVLTSDKIVIIDQTSIFRQRVTPINLENFTSASAETQYGNLFPFGVLHLDLIEGVGAEYKLKFIHHADAVASKITECLTMFQRRKDLRRYPHGDVPPDEA